MCASKRQMYRLVELRSGKKDIHGWDRSSALKEAHRLNVKYPNRRYAICAVS